MADSADAAAGLQWEIPSPPETPVKALVLDSSHTSMSGVFYPKGHVLVLFPSAELARQAADALEASVLLQGRGAQVRSLQEWHSRG